MSRYIDADAYPTREWLIDFLYDCGIRDADISIEDIADELSLLVSNIPTADVVEVKRGEWNHPYHYGVALPEHQCSECGYWEYADSKSNYCPNCGARMDEREEEDDKGND